MEEMIKEHDKFFSRMLSKETSITNPSFRVYYGVPIGVPFVWEAKPGTPKHPNSNSLSPLPLPLPLPPLTPPPSYSSQLNHKKSSISPSKKGRMIFQGLFPKMMHNQHRRQISSASSSTATTLSSSDSGSMTREFGRSRSLSSSSNQGGGLVFDFSMKDRDPEEEEEEEGREIMRSGSPRTILCFGFVGGKKIRSPSIA